jgi:hypothetical protein
MLQYFDRRGVNCGAAYRTVIIGGGVAKGCTDTLFFLFMLLIAADNNVRTTM